MVVKDRYYGDPEREPWEESLTTKLFDITCTVGSVYTDPNGTATAYVMALTIIGEHGAPGEYSFPLENGCTCIVNISHELQS